MKSPRSFRKKLLCASVASVLGLAASGPANADTYEFSFVGAFTMLNEPGNAFPNQATKYNAGYNDPYGWFGNRTPITGIMTYDSTAGTGTVTINGFAFFDETPNTIAMARDITFQSIGNGVCTTTAPASCQPGNLLLANMMFDWNLNNGIPVSIVWNAQGLFGALPTAIPGTIIQGVGALPASENIDWKVGPGAVTYPLGPTPVAVTSWNTTPLCVGGGGATGACMNVNPNGGLPLLASYPAGYFPGHPGDPATTGGSPMLAGPFPSYNANFDFMKVTLTKKNGLSGPPLLQTKAPADGSTNVNEGVAVTFSFTNSMQAATVATAFSLTGPGGTISHGSGGTLSPSSGNATNFTFTPSADLAFTTAYTATITDDARDIAGQKLSDAPAAVVPIVWSFTTAAQVVSTACAPVAQVPVGSNFTMLNGGGIPLTEATNDIAYSFPFDPDNIQPGDLNTSEAGANINMTMGSATSMPFFGHSWTAHTIRVFGGPKTYVFDTTCTVNDIMNSISNCMRPLGPGQTERYMTMTVGANQLGAHMLFNWNVHQNIDVVNVWSRNSKWSSDPVDRAGTNDLFGGEAWAGPAGLTVNPNTTWKFVSTDPDGDGINGVQMVDGAFIGFRANFNLSAADSCLAAPPTPVEVGEITSASGGCSISKNPSAISVLDKADWLLLGGFLAWLGTWRFRARRVLKS